MPKKQHVNMILDLLKHAYPDAHCALIYHTPFELLVATMLSAQCTDQRVNQVTADLFQKYQGPHDFAVASLADIEADIHSTGFFRAKAKAIQVTSQILLSEHQGQVPCDMQALTRLRGVGRKTASVVMGNAFNQAEGVVVDTHVGRLSRRLGFSVHLSAEKVEQDLMKLIPRVDWVIFPHLMIAHGRAICKARKPLCQTCCLQSHCPSAL